MTINRCKELLVKCPPLPLIIINENNIPVIIRITLTECIGFYEIGSDHSVLLGHNAAFHCIEKAIGNVYWIYVV